MIEIIIKKNGKYKDVSVVTIGGTAIELGLLNRVEQLLLIEKLKDAIYELEEGNGN